MLIRAWGGVLLRTPWEASHVGGSAGTVTLPYSGYLTHSWGKLAVPPGFEPELFDPNSNVLPLHNGTMNGGAGGGSRTHYVFCHDGLQIRYLTVRRRRPIKWYPGRDSNPHVVTTTVFKTVMSPFPSPGQIGPGSEIRTHDLLRPKQSR